MKNLAAVAVCCLSVMASCSNPDAWSNALEETAPPNPNRAHPISRDTRPETNATTPAQEQEPETPVESQTSAQEESGPQPTLISATLEGYPGCHVGAVRFYVNRRYKGQFDEEGNITLEVTPGEQTLEVWDSGGHWLKTVSVPEGQTFQVVFGCDEKMTMSDDP